MFCSNSMIEMYRKVQDQDVKMFRVIIRVHRFSEFFTEHHTSRPDPTKMEKQFFDWMKKNITGHWTNTIIGEYGDAAALFFFDDNKEAMKFKLVWG